MHTTVNLSLSFRTKPKTTCIFFKQRQRETCDNNKKVIFAIQTLRLYLLKLVFSIRFLLPNCKYLFDLICPLIIIFFFLNKILFQTRDILRFDQPDNTKTFTSIDDPITLEKIAHDVLFQVDQELLNVCNLNKIKRTYHFCFYIAFLAFKVGSQTRLN